PRARAVRVPVRALRALPPLLRGTRAHARWRAALAGRAGRSDRRIQGARAHELPPRARGTRVPHERHLAAPARRAAARHTPPLRGLAALVVPARRAARPRSGRADPLPRARAEHTRG